MDEELINSTINLVTYRDPLPYRSDENIYAYIGDDINIEPYDVYIITHRTPKNEVRLNIKKQENVQKMNDNVTNLRISYTI